MPSSYRRISGSCRYGFSEEGRTTGERQPSLLYVTTTFPKGQSYGIADNAFWPRITLVLLLVLSSVMAFWAWWELRGNAARSATTGSRRQEAERGSPRKLLAALAASATYLLALGPVGFLVSTPPYVAALMGILEERRVARLVGSALLADALFFVLFAKVASYELPRGAGLFRELSLLLY